MKRNRTKTGGGKNAFGEKKSQQKKAVNENCDPEKGKKIKGESVV